jgi:hypothetical protein
VLQYLDGPRRTLFEIMLSLSKKMSIKVATSWILAGASCLHCSNRKITLAANNSSRSSLLGSSHQIDPVHFSRYVSPNIKDGSRHAGYQLDLSCFLGRILGPRSINVDFPDHAILHGGPR